MYVLICLQLCIHACFSCLSGLHEFSLLQELILDNNQLPDETEFPALKTLSTLTLNNNKISFTLSRGFPIL